MRGAPPALPHDTKLWPETDIKLERSAPFLFHYLSVFPFHSAASVCKYFNMATPKVEAVSAEHDENAAGPREVPVLDEKYASGRIVQVQAASVALAAAIAAQKPSLLSKNMFKLYFIMAIGYLVSTMNGFGTSPITHSPL
jgi:hypothetical protein